MFGQVSQDLQTLARLDSGNGRDQTPRYHLVVLHSHLHLAQHTHIQETLPFVSEQLTAVSTRKSSLER